MNSAEEKLYARLYYALEWGGFYFADMFDSNSVYRNIERLSADKTAKKNACLEHLVNVGLLETRDSASFIDGTRIGTFESDEMRWITKAIDSAGIINAVKESTDGSNWGVTYSTGIDYAFDDSGQSAGIKSYSSISIAWGELAELYKAVYGSLPANTVTFFAMAKLLGDELTTNDRNYIFSNINPGPLCQSLLEAYTNLTRIVVTAEDILKITHETGASLSSRIDAIRTASGMSSNDSSTVYSKVYAIDSSLTDLKITALMSLMNVSGSYDPNNKDAIVRELYDAFMSKDTVSMFVSKGGSPEKKKYYSIADRTAEKRLREYFNNKIHELVRGGISDVADKLDSMESELNRVTREVYDSSLATDASSRIDALYETVRELERALAINGYTRNPTYVISGTEGRVQVPSADNTANSLLTSAGYLSLKDGLILGGDVTSSPDMGSPTDTTLARAKDVVGMAKNYSSHGDGAYFVKRTKEASDGFNISRELTFPSGPIPVSTQYQTLTDSTKQHIATEDVYFDAKIRSSGTATINEGKLSLQNSEVIILFPIIDGYNSAEIKITATGYTGGAIIGFERTLRIVDLENTKRIEDLANYTVKYDGEWYLPIIFPAGAGTIDKISMNFKSNNGVKFTASGNIFGSKSYFDNSVYIGRGTGDTFKANVGNATLKSGDNKIDIGSSKIDIITENNNSDINIKSSRDINAEASSNATIKTTSSNSKIVIENRVSSPNGEETVNSIELGKENDNTPKIDIHTKDGNINLDGNVNAKKNLSIDGDLTVKGSTTLGENISKGKLEVMYENATINTSEGDGFSITSGDNTKIEANNKKITVAADANKAKIELDASSTTNNKATISAGGQTITVDGSENKIEIGDSNYGFISDTTNKKIEIKSKSETIVLDNNAGAGKPSTSIISNNATIASGSNTQINVTNNKITAEAGTDNKITVNNEAINAETSGDATIMTTGNNSKIAIKNIVSSSGGLETVSSKIELGKDENSVPKIDIYTNGGKINLEGNVKAIDNLSIGGHLTVDGSTTLGENTSTGTLTVNYSKATINTNEGDGFSITSGDNTKIGAKSKKITIAADDTTGANKAKIELDASSSNNKATISADSYQTITVDGSDRKIEIANGAEKIVLDNNTGDGKPSTLITSNNATIASADGNNTKINVAGKTITATTSNKGVTIETTPAMATATTIDTDSINLKGNTQIGEDSSKKNFTVHGNTISMSSTENTEFSIPDGKNFYVKNGNDNLISANNSETKLHNETKVTLEASANTITLSSDGLQAETDITVGAENSGRNFVVYGYREGNGEDFVVRGHTKLDGNLNSTGTTTLNLLNVSGNANVGRTLEVTGQTTLSTLTASGATTLASTTASSLNVSGNADVGGTLEVTGQTTLSTLTASGATTLASTTASSLNVSGNANVGRTLEVTGQTTLKGTVTAKETATFEKLVKIGTSSPDTTNNKMLEVIGKAYVSDLYVNNIRWVPYEYDDNTWGGIRPDVANLVWVPASKDMVEAILNNEPYTQP